MSNRTIPDLRMDTTIELDHVYILVQTFGKVMDDIEGTDGVFKNLADELDPVMMRDFYIEKFDPDSFGRLFKTELGRGVLVGAYAQALFTEAENLEDDMQDIEF